MMWQSLVSLTGPERAVRIFGVMLFGLTAETGRKVLLSIAVVAVVGLIARGALY